MTRLYLNGKLCNGSGRGKDEYTLSELKQIAKDNNLFVFSVSTKEDICKEIIKHHKKSKQPIVISPKISNAPKAISVEPVVVSSASKVASATKVSSAAKAASASKAYSVKTPSKQLAALEKQVEKAKINAEDAEAKYLATLENIEIYITKKEQVLWAAIAEKKTKKEVLAMSDKFDKRIEIMTQKSEKAKEKYYDLAKIAMEKITALEEFTARAVTKSPNVAKSPKATKATEVTPKVAASKPKEPKNECVKINNKKYSERPSPAYPANECRDKVLLGNDGNQYISVPNKAGIYRWVLLS